MRILERLIGLVAPHDCLSCGLEGTLLCNNCRLTLEPIPARCYRCHAISVDSRTCDKCRKHSALRNVWIATNYEGPAKELVRQLKFSRTAAASVPIARSMLDALPHQPRNMMIVPVPTASNRVRQRGYDQVRLIVGHLAQECGRENASLLVRVGHSRQVGSSRKQRLTQLEGAFRVSRGKLDYVTGKDILLVDDIVTTGATLESAARVLKSAGAKSISAVVFAQKQ